LRWFSVDAAPCHQSLLPPSQWGPHVIVPLSLLPHRREELAGTLTRESEGGRRSRPAAMEEEELAEPCTSPSESVRRKEQDESVVHRQMEQGEGGWRARRRQTRCSTPLPRRNGEEAMVTAGRRRSSLRTLWGHQARRAGELYVDGRARTRGRGACDHGARRTSR
jgi:hypothetical protein